MVRKLPFADGRFFRAQRQVGLRRRHKSSVGRVQSALQFNRELLRRFVFYEYFRKQRSVLVVGRKIRAVEHVGDVYVRQGINGYVAENARQTPEILVFEIRAVAVLVDFERNAVAPRLDIVGDIESRGSAAVLRVADLFAVNPKIERAAYPVEFYIDALRRPMTWVCRKMFYTTQPDCGILRDSLRNARAAYPLRAAHSS